MHSLIQQNCTECILWSRHGAGLALWEIRRWNKTHSSQVCVEWKRLDIGLANCKLLGDSSLGYHTNIKWVLQSARLGQRLLRGGDCTEVLLGGLVVSTTKWTAIVVLRVMKCRRSPWGRSRRQSLQEGENGVLLPNLGLLKMGLQTCSCTFGARRKDHRNRCHQRSKDSSQHTEPVEDMAVKQLFCVLFPLTCLYPHTRLFSVFAAKKVPRVSLKSAGNSDSRKWGEEAGKEPV